MQMTLEQDTEWALRRVAARRQIDEWEEFEAAMQEFYAASSVRHRMPFAAFLDIAGDVVNIADGLREDEAEGRS
jgi:hypothetical protein